MSEALTTSALEVAIEDAVIRAHRNMRADNRPRSDAIYLIAHELAEILGKLIGSAVADRWELEDEMHAHNAIVEEFALRTGRKFGSVEGLPQ